MNELHTISYKKNLLVTLLYFCFNILKLSATNSSTADNLQKSAYYLRCAYYLLMRICLEKQIKKYMVTVKTTGIGQAGNLEKLQFLRILQAKKGVLSCQTGLL